MENSAAAMFEQEIRSQFGGTVLAVVRRAVGFEADEMLVDDVLISTVFVVRDEIVTLWLLTPGAFVYVQVARRGDWISVVVPLWRIRRVSETHEGGVASLLIELDADRTLITASGDTGGIMNPAFYEIVPLGDAETRQVRRFGDDIRRVITGGA